MRLLGNRLLLSPLPVKEFSDGGIVLPQGQVGDKKMLWRVDQVGPGIVRKSGVNPMAEFEVGQTVVTPLFFSHHTLEDGTGRKIIDCDQVVAVIEEETADI